MGEKWETDAVVFVGTVVDDAVLIDVENGTKHEFGMVKGVGEIGDIGEVAVRHAYYIIDAEGRLEVNVGVAAVIEVLFIGIKIASGGIGTEARLVRGGVEVTAQVGVIG